MSGATIGADLDRILDQTPGLWEDLRGARVFFAGGTGFFGCWLLESFLHADRKLGLGASAVVLTRDEKDFRSRRPHLAAAAELSFHVGDVRDFVFPAGRFTHVVNCAADGSGKVNRERPGLMKDVIVAGTRRTLEFALASGAKRYLLSSSGAVYGRQRPETARVAEDDPAAVRPLEAPSANAEGKREAEALCVAAAQKGLTPAIARGFAFLGPYLSFDGPFAAGNFIRDALRGGPIEIMGDGTPLRSYLYASDLAVWLWTILLKGEPGRAYNVGSEKSVSIAELAQSVAAAAAPGVDIRAARKPESGRSLERYVPDTKRARTELGLRETVDLDEAIRRTAAWAAESKTGFVKAAKSPL